MSRDVETCLAGISLFFAMVNPARAQECPRLAGASPDELTSYLEKTPASPRDECAAFAIKEVGGFRYEPAAPALTKWLDLRWPTNARQKQRRWVIEQEGFTIYPAAAALEAMGKDALPAVLEAIKTNKHASREWLEVAAEVWMMTAYKDQAPTGVAALRQQAQKAMDPAVRNRVSWAAFFATRWCNPSERAQCDAALNTQYGD